ncbi:ABC transporter transmembrane domain-containing protein [Robertmurraya massiliosenegalensis]|uniref:ABC transporter transmembrane domain-containing protein n=1 Tax=Robertmurraya massiliosenegalensis TaxID=1287657 RepID=UPI00054EA92C
MNRRCCPNPPDNKKTRENSRKERESFSKILNSTQETINGINTIKVFSKESFFTRMFARKLDHHFRFVQHHLFFNLT